MAGWTCCMCQACVRVCALLDSIAIAALGHKWRRLHVDVAPHAALLSSTMHAASSTCGKQAALVPVPGTGHDQPGTASAARRCSVEAALDSDCHGCSCQLLHAGRQQLLVLYLSEAPHSAAPGIQGRWVTPRTTASSNMYISTTYIVSCDEPGSAIAQLDRVARCGHMRCPRRATCY